MGALGTEGAITDWLGAGDAGLGTWPEDMPVSLAPSPRDPTLTCCISSGFCRNRSGHSGHLKTPTCAVLAFW